MSELTAEQLAQRIYECRLLESKEIDKSLALAGGRGEATIDDFVSELIKNEQLTNWQVQRLIEGHRRGYFYGSWKVLYLVGAGTFARVYRGVHRKTGDVKAIKVLRNRYSNDDETRERFAREARMVMKLRHPNIVPINEVESDRGRSYMVMDFVEGQNLRDYVRTHKRLSIKVALNILRDLASGLTYAAERGITHRDLKLSNVLLTSTGSARLVDFGLATANEQDDAADGVFNPRSVDYAGLEKATHAKRNDPRSDIYFLGCILYHMIAGESPLEETRERIKRLSARRYQEVKPLTNHDDTLPHRVVILCNRLMDLNPENRIQTPDQVLRETEAVIAALESGDLARYDKELSEKHAEEYAKLMHREEEGAGKTVLIVESNIQVQDSLRDRLKELGYRVLITGDPARAMTRFEDVSPGEDDLPAHCVIFGCAGLGAAALDAFNRFATHAVGRQIPAILMVGPNQQKYLDRANFSDIRTHLELPVKFKNVRRTLRQLLNIPDPPDDIPGSKLLKS